MRANDWENKTSQGVLENNPDGFEAAVKNTASSITKDRASSKALLTSDNMDDDFSEIRILSSESSSSSRGSSADFVKEAPSKRQKTGKERNTKVKDRKITIEGKPETKALADLEEETRDILASSSCMEAKKFKETKRHNVVMELPVKTML